MSTTKGIYDKRLDTMSFQEIFDETCKHLLTQNRKSAIDHDGDMTCAYRGPDNTKCAAGIFIPDDVYTEGIEGNAWWTDAISKGLDEKKTDFIFQLQTIHDFYSPDQWKQELTEFAMDRGIIPPP